MRSEGSKSFCAIVAAALSALVILFGVTSGTVAESTSSLSVSERQQHAPSELAEADLLQRAVAEQLDLLGTEEMDRFLSSLDDDVRRHLPIGSLRDLVTDPQGVVRLDPLLFGRNLLRYLVGEVLLQSRLLGQIIVLAVLCALLHNLASTLSASATDFGFLVAYMVIIFLGVQSFHVAVGVGRETLAAMSGFMFALLPLMATMLAAVGAVSSAALFHPLLVTVVTLVVSVIEQLVFPLLFFAAIVGIVGQIVTDFPLSRLAQLFRQGAMSSLGLAFTVFLGAMVIRGSIAPVADGVALRTTKFLVGAVIPVVGGMMSDAMEVVVGGSMLIKNALGVFGLVTLLVLIAFPLVKILALVIIYRVATAVVQPISDARLVEALGTMANTLTVLVAAVATAAVMFFVVITIVIGIGNLAAVVR